MPRGKKRLRTTDLEESHRTHGQNIVRPILVCAQTDRKYKIASLLIFLGLFCQNDKNERFTRPVLNLHQNCGSVEVTA